MLGTDSWPLSCCCCVNKLDSEPFSAYLCWWWDNACNNRLGTRRYSGILAWWMHSPSCRWKHRVEIWAVPLLPAPLSPNSGRATWSVDNVQLQPNDVLLRTQNQHCFRRLQYWMCFGPSREFSSAKCSRHPCKLLSECDFCICVKQMEFIYWLNRLSGIRQWRITHFAGLAPHTIGPVRRHRQHCNTDEKLPLGIYCFLFAHSFSCAKRIFGERIINQPLSLRATPPKTISSMPCKRKESYDKFERINSHFTFNLRPKTMTTE